MSLRTLALAAALIGSVAVPAFADQDRVPEGATASGAWTQTASRTPLAGSIADAQQTFLERSGATGGDG
ncbi:hypothetical protein [Roseomonas populi]|uniref:Uncharacterized protein n=1 Tax=Roseomonas populi TaxID=3121582 RepID=A0ABT1XA46_9PROT|nr:hypothetical protein [Roseomonas pecuniae]MCR0984975.1 hypothetical protein [Roseomonas pecuniae]